MQDILQYIFESPFNKIWLVARPLRFDIENVLILLNSRNLIFGNEIYTNSKESESLINYFIKLTRTFVAMMDVVKLKLVAES